VQGAGAWLIVTSLLATITVAVRAVALGLAATARFTAPEPVPPVTLSEIHGTRLVADHVQPDPAVTESVTVAPAATTEVLVGETV
jgi:hypothetical protein